MVTESPHSIRAEVFAVRLYESLTQLLDEIEKACEHYTESVI
jgi:hypothetical protein